MSVVSKSAKPKTTTTRDWHCRLMTFYGVDLAQPPSDELPRDVAGILIAWGDPARPGAEWWAERSTFVLTEIESDDRRSVRVDSIPAALAEIDERLVRWPQAASVCDDVLRTVDVTAPARNGIITESLAYSTLQAGSEFARWLKDRAPKTPQPCVNPVNLERNEGQLDIRLNRPQRHNAFSNDMRAALLEALEIAELDSTIGEVVLSGAGPSFCSGGDLTEFGTFADPTSAHLARTRYSPGLSIEAIKNRLGRSMRAEIHGRALGSGLEMAAFCGHVVCTPDAVLGLPELRLGLIPGAGGTVSVTRRIGRWRTAYLVLTGRTIDAATALGWGLVDAIED